MNDILYNSLIYLKLGITIILFKNGILFKNVFHFSFSFLIFQQNCKLKKLKNSEVFDLFDPIDRIVPKCNKIP
jgi:hypothetical protein